MDNIKIASVCGLCAGCKNAITQAESALQKYKKVSLFKEIVHNEFVTDKLKALGIEIKHELSQVSPEEVLIIRAHGEPPQTYDYLNSHGIRYIDCTCKNVEVIHKKVKLHSSQGDLVVIIGKYGKKTGVFHPEVYATKYWCETEPVLIEDSEDIEKLDGVHDKSLYLICQTTFNEKKANELIQQITKLCKENNNSLKVDSTICGAQKAINISSAELAKDSDLMLVVGSKSSSNTTELYNNLSGICKTIFIDDFSIIKDIIACENITKSTKIGITAGASTDPVQLLKLKNIIEGEL